MNLSLKRQTVNLRPQIVTTSPSADPAHIRLTLQDQHGENHILDCTHKGTMTMDVRLALHADLGALYERHGFKVVAWEQVQHLSMAI